MRGFPLSFVKHWYNEQHMESLFTAYCSIGSEQTYNTRKPVRTLKLVTNVFYQDGCYCAKVPVHRIFEATNFPPQTVQEFLQNTNEVDKSKRTFNTTERRTVLAQLNEKDRRA